MKLFMKIELTVCVHVLTKEFDCIMFRVKENCVEIAFNGELFLTFDLFFQLTTSSFVSRSI